MLRNLLGKISRQRDMPPYIGAMINVYSSTAILYSPLTLMGVATTVYGLWGADAIRGWLPWFTIWHLLGVMGLFILVMMVVFHRYVLPSIFAFQVQQQYKHRNPMAQDTQTILKQQKEFGKRLRRVEAMLAEIRNAMGNGDTK